MLLVVNWCHIATATGAYERSESASGIWAPQESIAHALVRPPRRLRRQDGRGPFQGKNMAQGQRCQSQRMVIDLQEATGDLGFAA